MTRHTNHLLNEELREAQINLDALKGKHETLRNNPETTIDDLMKVNRGIVELRTKIRRIKARP